MNSSANYTNLRRQRWLNEGLTTEGRERRNKRHPDLANLKGKAYHLEYMRKQRRQDREAWNDPDQRPGESPKTL